MAESNARQGSTSSKSSGASESPGSADDTKRRFREALDRKMSKSSGGSDHKDRGGKQSRAHGAAGGGRREFRRKSG